jgi:hypothetical protein
VNERKNASEVSPAIPPATPFNSVSPIAGTSLLASLAAEAPPSAPASFAQPATLSAASDASALI